MTQSVVAIGLSLALLIAVLLLSSRLGARFSLHVEAQRKIVHVSLGLYALLFPLIFSEPWEVVTLCVLAAATLIGARVLPGLSGSLGSALYGVKRESVGELLFAFSIALLFLLSRDQIVLYVLPLLILALCDTFAALVGVSYGKISFVVEKGRKSVEGSIMFFLTAWILAMISLLLLSGLSRDEVVVSSLIVAGIGTLLEGISWKGLDNLFIPFGLFLLTQKILEMSLWGLMTMTTVFLVALALALWLSIRAAQHVHAVMTIVAAVFFCWMAGGWGAVVAPAVVFAGYLYLRARAEFKAGDGSELPLAFCLISTAMVWYILAQVLNIGTYYAFNLSFGMHLIALVVIHERARSVSRVAAALLIGWLVANVRLLFIEEFGVRDLQLSFAALSILVLAVLVGMAARTWLLHNRWSKQAVFVVLASSPALAVPLWI